MNIVYFYQYFGTPKGSWSTRVYEMTRRWVQAGHRVTVVTAPYEKSDLKAHGFISRQEVEGIQLIVINAGDSNRLGLVARMTRALLFATVASYYALVLPCHAVIASSGPITIGIPLILAKWIRRRKTVFEVRDLWPAGGIEMGLIKSKWQQKIALWFEKACYRSADLVVAASLGQQQHILANMPDLRTEVVPNASDLELFGPPVNEELPAWAQSHHIFTHIGSLGLINNIQYWMDVADELQQIDTEHKILLVFIGEGAHRAGLEVQKRDRALDNIVFLGLKPKYELPLWVQKSCATIFATLDLPVQDACSPNKVFDSFAAGVPVIQTTKGWIRDLVEVHECGVNVSLSEPKQAAQAILNLVHNQSERDRLGHNAKMVAETLFDRNKLSTKYLHALLSL